MACCNGHGTQGTGLCVECETPQLARNHFFTGKLLVERDFSDEQRYFLGKEKRHNQRLHGWGTVCGLKVTAHPNQACRGQYVVLKAGTAIDCCGHEILLRDDEVFDFRADFRNAWKQKNGADSEPDTAAHTLQICIQYNECSAEPVPSLFDDCGCDDSGCQPNRILEGHRVGVVIDAPDRAADELSVKLTWAGTITKLDHPKRIVMFMDRIYVLTSGPDAAVFSADAVTGAVSVPVSFSQAAGVDIAISRDGKSLFVALHASGDADPKVLLLDATDLATAPTQTAVLTGAGNAEVRMTTTADGRLFTVSPNQNKLFVFDAFLTAGSDIAVGTSPVALAAGDGYLYTANSGSGDFQQSSWPTDQCRRKQWALARHLSA